MASVPDSELEALRWVAEAARHATSGFCCAADQRALCVALDKLDRATRKTLGQVACEAYGHDWNLTTPHARSEYERTADAVVAEHERRKAEGA